MDWWKDLLTEEHIDLDAVLNTIVVLEESFQSDIGVGPRVDDVEVPWEEEKGREQKVQAHATTGSLDATATTLNVIAGDGVKVRTGSVIKDTTAGKTESILVTAVTTDALTIVRGHPGASGAETHANSAVYMVVSHTGHERMDPTSEADVPRSKVSNYCQLFERSVEIPFLRPYVKSKTVPDELKHQIELRVGDLATEYNRTLLYGKKAEFQIGTNWFYNLNGLVAFVSQSGGHVVTAGATLTPDVIDALNDDIMLTCPDNRAPNRLLTTRSLGGKISNFDIDKVRREPGDKRRGTGKVTIFETKYGNEFQIVRDLSLLPGTIILYNNKFVEKKPLVPLIQREVPNKSIVKQTQLLSAFTVKCPNPKETTGIQTNLT